MVLSMPTSNGSAASAPKALPKSAVRGVVLHCSKHMRQAALLAEIQASGAEPELGAEHILGVLEDLRVELSQLRAFLRQNP